MHPICCGLDVHKRSVVACLIRPGPGGQPEKQVRTFGTMTDELQAPTWLLPQAGQLVGSSVMDGAAGDRVQQGAEQPILVGTKLPLLIVRPQEQHISAISKPTETVATRS